LHLYRDRDGREIDLIIEQDGRLYPVEIKKTATPIGGPDCSSAGVSVILRKASRLQLPAASFLE
jgi:Holliday junction resolvase-like predicted endonuclease